MQLATVDCGYYENIGATDLFTRVHTVLLQVLPVLSQHHVLHLHGQWPEVIEPTRTLCAEMRQTALQQAQAQVAALLT